MMLFDLPNEGGEPMPFDNPGPATIRLPSRDSVWAHVATGKLYTVRSLASLQTVNTDGALTDGLCLVLYQATDRPSVTASWHARPVTEFLDGRFRQVLGVV